MINKGKKLLNPLGKLEGPADLHELIVSRGSELRVQDVKHPR